MQIDSESSATGTRCCSRLRGTSRLTSAFCHSFARADDEPLEGNSPKSVWIPPPDKARAREAGFPLSTAAVQVTFGLREIEEQEVSHDTVVDTNFPERNLLVSVGHFLQVAVVILQRIAIDLGGA